MTSPFQYGIDTLSIAKAMALAEGRMAGELSARTKAKVEVSSGHVQDMVDKQQVVYGINTGFGPLCDTLISPEETSHLQHNLLKSHAVGVGEPIGILLSRMMLVLKLQALTQGYSGIRWSTLERIHWMLEQDIVPVVPAQGSVGASGDLAPLAHLFLPLIGMGEVHYNQDIIPTKEVLRKFQKDPITLGPKEGLALINGTQFIAAHAIWALARLFNLMDTADICGALSLEGFMGSSKPFDARLHGIRPFPGNQYVAYRLDQLLTHSQIRQSHASCSRVQDPYSLRCMPQVHGTTRTAWLHLKTLCEIEINAVTDNPIILGAFDSISGGNFHGQPLAVPLDYLHTAAAELGSISERRSYLLIEGKYGLPKLLIEDAGLNSGFMIPQYTAAALVSENKSRCFPASADSIPTSLGQEDHVSMGSISGRKLHKTLDNLEYILAIELLYAAQAIDFRRPLKTSPILEGCHALVRSQVAFTQADRVFSKDILALGSLIHKGELQACAYASARKHQIDLNPFAYERFSIS